VIELDEHRTYLFDEARAEKLRQSNPEAFRNCLRRMLEADGRGFWNPDEGVREKLQELYSEVEDEIEGVSF
jgi:magnesium chelatase subunit H